MKINPVKGTADYLPSQTLLRDYLQNIILETYREAGFERIMTPAIEDMDLRPLFETETPLKSVIAAPLRLGKVDSSQVTVIGEFRE